jgi:dipeptidyl aminopeptidase/acylaminoacyl peptidase
MTMRSNALAIAAATIWVSSLSQAADKHVPTIVESLSRPIAGSLAVAPDGRAVAYLKRETDWKNNEFVWQLWLVDAQRHDVQLTRGRKSIGAPQFSPDGQWLAFVTERDSNALEPYAEKKEGDKDPAKPAKSQLWLLATAGGEAWQVTKSETDVQQFRFSKDGRFVVFSAAAPETKASKDRSEQLSGLEVIDHDYTPSQLYRIDLAAAIATTGPVNAKRLLSDRNLNVTSFAVSPDGDEVAFAATQTPLLAFLKDEDVFLLDSSGDKPARRIVALEGPDSDPVFSADGKRLLFASSLAQPYFFYANRHIVSIDLGAVDKGPVTSPQAVNDLARDFDEDGQVIASTQSGVYFAANQKTGSLLFRLDPETRHINSVTPPELHVNQAASSPDGRYLAYVADDPTHVTEVYLQGPDGAAKKLTDLTAKVADFTLGSVEVVSWKSKDGTLIEGVLRKPADYDAHRKYPLLVRIHGGPTGIDEPGYWPSDYAYPLQNFLAKGALILEPNYRGSAGYGAKFRALNVRNLGVGDMWDVMSGIDALIAKGIVDPNRLASMGWSQGGYISAFLTTHTDRFKAISVGAGISDWSTYYVSTDITPFTPQYLHATPWDDPAIYAKTSPITTIRQAKTPTLIQHGSLDKRVPVPDSFELYRGLLDQHVDSRLILYTGFGHGINKPKSQLALEQANLDWFNHYIWGEVFPKDSALYGTHELPE